MRVEKGSLSITNRLTHKEWQNVTPLKAESYKCYFCNKNISSSYGYWQNPENGYIFICPECGQPTYFDKEMNQYPASPYGNCVKYITNESVKLLYEEARRCYSNNCFTAMVLCCRKLLMNIAVDKDAGEGKKFIEYVTYLNEKGYIPTGGKSWVDAIRTKGNEATHEIVIMSKEDAQLIFNFSCILLKIIYEMPNSLTQIESEF